MTEGVELSHLAARHVLLIEDEPNIAEAIRFILSRDGWRVTLHAEGADAVARIRAVLPDIVILDLMLPGRSGLEILAEMRADPAMSGVPVLMLTARGQERDREAATRAGATRFLAKPFANSDLKRCIQEMAREGAGALAGTAAPEASAMSDAVLRRSETH